jgi:hypothetical protein
MILFRYLVAALLVAAFPISARGEHLLVFQLGEHEYNSSIAQRALGAEYIYKAPSALSFGLGGDYLSSDFGGEETDFNAVRFFGGPNIHLIFGCLPIELVPGVGLEYLTVRDSPFSRDEAFGGYARGRVLVRIIQEVSAGITYRKSWNAIDDRGTEWAATLQFNFGTKKKKPERRREPEEDPSQYVRASF